MQQRLSLRWHQERWLASLACSSCRSNGLSQQHICCCQIGLLPSCSMQSMTASCIHRLGNTSTPCSCRQQAQAQPGAVAALASEQQGVTPWAAAGSAAVAGTGVGLRGVQQASTHMHSSSSSNVRHGYTVVPPQVACKEA